MNIIDTRYYKEDGKLYLLNIDCDYDFPLNPREDYDNIGHMVCFHRRYTLGDDHNFSEPADFLESLMDNSNIDHDEDMTIGQMISVLREHDYYFLPLSIYDHSGITMYVGSPDDHFDGQWDCSYVGWIYTTKQDIEKDFPNETKWTDRANAVLTGEVKTYDLYLRGDCYGYCLEEYDPENDTYEEIESCGGFLTDAYGEALAIEMIGECDFISEEEAEEYKNELQEQEQERQEQEEKAFTDRYAGVIDGLVENIREVLNQTAGNTADMRRIVNKSVELVTA